MSEETSTPPIPNDKKLELECEKIKAEIEAIRKPFHKTTAFYVSITPAILAICGLLFTYYSGWFDVQRTRVSNDKTLLEAQKQRLEMDQLALQAETNKISVHIAELEFDVQNLRYDKTTLTNQIAQLERDKDEMRAAKEYYESEATRLAGSETNAAIFLSALQVAQKDRTEMESRLQKYIVTNQLLQSYCSNANAFVSVFDSLAAPDVNNFEGKPFTKDMARSLYLHVSMVEMARKYMFRHIRTYDELVPNTRLLKGGEEINHAEITNMIESEDLDKLRRTLAQ